MQNLNEINNAVKNGKLYNSHTSRCRGYISRKLESKIFIYNGKFGKGYKVLTPNWESTRYCFITYYLVK